MSSQACPSCGTEVPVDARYVTWCDACDWNMLPAAPPEPEGRLEGIAAAAGRRLGDRMAERLALADDLAPRLTPSKVAAYAIAAAVHAFVAAVVAAAVWLLLADLGLLPKIGGALLVVLAFLMRPRLGRSPTEGIVTRRDAPALYSLVDEIARSLGTPAAHTISITFEYTASWSVVGVRRERVLTLGLPLLSVLEPQEQVALIAHELAHARNGDSTRGLVVGSAIESLSELYETLAPPSGQLRGSELDVAELLVRPVVWLLAQPLRLLLLLELHLLLHDAKRAEYLADRMAATAAGTRAVIGLHEKLLLGAVTKMAVHRFAISRSERDTDVFDALRAAVSAVPARELERQRRVARLEETRLGATHPPTGKRIEVLERRPATEPRTVLARTQQAAIAAELGALRRTLSRRIVEEYRASVAY